MARLFLFVVSVALCALQCLSAPGQQRQDDSSYPQPEPTGLPYLPLTSKPPQPGLNAAAAAAPVLDFGQVSIQSLCSKCAFNHGVGYTAHPGSCFAYLMCTFDDEGVATNIYPFECSANLMWNQDKLACDYRENVDCNPQNNCPNTQSIPDDPSSYRVFNDYTQLWDLMFCPGSQRYSERDCDCIASVSTSQLNYTCVGDLRAINGDPTHYLQRVGDNWVTMPCPDNLIFDQYNCMCTYNPLGSSTIVAPLEECIPHLQLRFDQFGSAKDRSTHGFWIDNRNVTVENGYGDFNGSSKLIIPGLSNVDFRSMLYIRVQFQFTTPANNNFYVRPMQTLVANGDCEVQPAVSICTDESRVEAIVLSPDSGSPFVLSSSVNSFSNSWQEVLFRVDDGVAELQSPIGNQQDSAEYLTSIPTRHRGLVIGGGGSCGNFVGRIKEVDVYTVCRPPYF